MQTRRDLEREIVQLKEQLEETERNRIDLEENMMEREHEQQATVPKLQSEVEALREELHGRKEECEKHTFDLNEMATQYARIQRENDDLLLRIQEFEKEVNDNKEKLLVLIFSLWKLKLLIGCCS
eukprot:m.192232 g.192232  ORF g.192232 m.192232 type:complete len:125 (+) comp13651_c1_seq2:2628-3002(+)